MPGTPHPARIGAIRYPSQPLSERPWHNATEAIYLALNRAPCAVAVAPAGYSQPPLVAVKAASSDGYGPASWLPTSRACALSSVPPASFGPGRVPHNDAMDTLLRQARAGIAQLEAVEPHVAYGAPAEELAWFSGTVDLLIVGARGYRPSARLAHGSTVTAAHKDCAFSRQAATRRRARLSRDFRGPDKARCVNAGPHRCQQ